MQDDYRSMFNSDAAAAAFEDEVLSIDPHLLPEPALEVRDGGEPTPEYWMWLVDQVEVESWHS